MDADSSPPVVMDDRVRIPLADGTLLAARIWRPADSDASPVPAILEYLPYRRRDGTAERDALTHPYFAAHGYSGVRVDMRGSGDSDGLLLGEYLKQEQDDALEVIAWLAAQAWCSGAVGMIGISWGGFNGLQIAARQPPALKAVISLCSTDDRYADDIHFMGGALLTNKMSWASDMLAISCNPPDPSIVGDRWRAMWLDRLEGQGLWLLDWLRHQRRDEFYRQGSICEDYGAIQCPVYAVGGWADGYSNAVFRLMRNLKVPVKGLVGPWAHKYPHFAKPGPQIGFLQECLRWWDHWLKGKDTGIMQEPQLLAWVNEGTRPLPHIETQLGRWVSEPGWPSANIVAQSWALRPGSLAATRGTEAMRVRSPATLGLASGSWSPSGLGFDLATDQRVEAGGSLIFDSAILTQPMDMLGAAIVDLRVASDQPLAQLACVLSEVLASGHVLRVSYAVLNLSHRDSHSDPSPLEPGRFYPIRLRLNEFGHRFAVGSQIRLAVSSAYWPTLWPAPTPTTLTIDPDATISLPVRQADSGAPRSFAPADGAEKLRTTVLRSGREARRIETDIVSGVVTSTIELDLGEWRIDAIDLTLTNESGETLRIHPDDPLSAQHETWWKRTLSRGSWQVRTAGDMTMKSDGENFHVTARVEAFEGERRLFERSWSEAIPRDHL
jgi:putative CocE/NonD family hydrolase